MLTRVHVNQAIIKSNHKTGKREPVLTVKTYQSNTYCHEVEILGPARLVYRPDNPLPCGARVWLETESEVICKRVNDAGVGNGVSDECGILIDAVPVKDVAAI